MAGSSTGETTLTAARPSTGQKITAAKYQHAHSVQRSALRIKNCADQVLQDMAHGRPPGTAARQIAADVQDLLRSLAVLGVLDEVAAMLRMQAA
jgi:hypothetical protein